jgi:hypothetical protein
VLLQKLFFCKVQPFMLWLVGYMYLGRSAV